MIDNQSNVRYIKTIRGVAPLFIFVKGVDCERMAKKALQKALELLCNAVIQILVGVLLIVISRYI